VAGSLGGEYLVIPNGIELPPPPRDRGAGGGILFVGRAEPRKGLPVLLEAFRRLGRGELTLVGVSPDELPHRVPRVQALGRVPDAERRRLLASADILCVPSLGQESFGLVVLEGMAAGVAVVASAIRAYADLMPPGCGRLVSPGDAGALAGALGELLDDAEGRRRMGEAGRQEAERYGWDVLLERLLAVYERAAEGSVAAPLQPAPLR
jgi:phosphatidylinositol alpha-mannosyltransferase